ncbi:uncharacterized protein LOC100185910 [Ciona intestinalis]
MEENPQTTVKTDMLMKIELVNLWQTTKTLRSMIQSCQNMVHSEAAKIEKECLDKIKDLEDKRVKADLKTIQVTEEINLLETYNKKLLEEKSALKVQCQQQEQDSRDLANQLIEAETKLEAFKERNVELENQLKTTVLENLNLRHRVSELEGHFEALVCEKDKQRNNILAMKEEKCDLEIAIAENDVYGQALQEHVDELEEICTTLRDQREEQSNYFIQREVAFKSSYESRLDEEITEKLNLYEEISSLQQQTEKLRVEVSLMEENKCTWCDEKKLLIQQKNEFEAKCKSIEDDLKLEKDTVSMLSSKNSELALALTDSKHELGRLAGDTLNKSLTENTFNEIEDLVTACYERKKKLLTEMAMESESETAKRLVECERNLSEERSKRKECEDKMQETEAQLEAANRNVKAMITMRTTHMKNIARSKIVKAQKDALNTSLDLNSFINIENKENPILTTTQTLDQLTPGMIETTNSGSWRTGILTGSQFEKLNHVNNKALEKLKRMSLC